MEPTKSSAKDFFLYLGIITTLYISVGSFLTLIFNYINYLFPDTLTDASYYYDPYTASVRFSLAVLMILFPVFLGFSYYQNKELRLLPAKKDISIRKWLLFLTLFLAGAIVVGDLITLVNTFLNGEITARFIYKVLTVLLVAGGTLYYYILDLRGTYIEKPKIGHVFGGTAFVVVLVAIVSGFFIIGSPLSARLLRFDSEKISDLQNIQNQIISYWQNKARLPENLNELKDSLSYSSIPTDPQTGTPYTLNVKGVYAFELCATFNKTTPERAYPNVSNSGSSTIYIPTAYPAGVGIEADNWKHGTGYVCFERTIDPEIYKPYQKTTTPLVK